MKIRSTLESNVSDFIFIQRDFRDCHMTIRQCCESIIFKKLHVHVATGISVRYGFEKF